MRSSRLWDPSFPFSPSRIPFFYGWIIVAAATVTTIFSIPGQTMGFSVFTDILIKELGLSRLQLSTAYFIGTVLSGFSLPYFGRLFDSHGSRRMIVLAACASGTILLYLSQSHRISDFASATLPFLAPQVWAFLVITLGFLLIRAAAQGVLTMTARITMGKWFDRQRGLTQSISGVLVSFSFSFSPKFLDWLIERLGWSGAWMFMGVATITIMGSLGWLFFRDNPEECGMLMDGGPGKKPLRRVNQDMVIHREFTRGEALRTPVFWVYNLSFSYHSLFGTAFTFHIISVGSSFGLSKDTILGFFIPMAIASVFWNLFCGWINPYIRLKYLLMAMNLAGVASTIAVLYLNQTWASIVFIIGMGICGGSFVTLSGIVWPRYYGRRWLGSINGIAMSSMVIASGIGPLLFSISLRWFQSYTPMIIACAAVPALLLACSLRAENPQRHAPTI